MTFFYWLSLVVGGGLFLLSLVGDAFGAHGHSHIGDGDVGTEGLHHDDFDWGRLFSIRNLTYALFGFGAVGVGMSLLWSGQKDVTTAVAAILTGVTAWLGSAAVFGYLRQSESGERLTDQSLIGRVGQITLPLLHGSTGKVLITRSGQTQELLAKPMDENDVDTQKWDSVVIVEMRDGIAFVAPYSEESSSER
jgi:membrane protein implicated in regulation of membrane protease activity